MGPRSITSIRRSAKTRSPAPWPLVVNGQTYHNVAANDYAAALQLAIWTELANSGSTTGPFSYSVVTGNSATVVRRWSRDFLAAAGIRLRRTGGICRLFRRSRPDMSQGQSFLVTPRHRQRLLTLGALALCCVIPACYWRRRRQA